MSIESIEEAKKCLNALGNAYRGDWSGVDGRSLREELEEIADVLEGEFTYEEYCTRNSIDPVKHVWV